MKAVALMLMTIALFSLVKISPCDAAALDAFLFIQGVPGEVSTPPHQNWIRVDSANWQDGLAPAGTGSKNQFEVSITKSVDFSSPILALAAADGQHFERAILEFQKLLGNGSRVVFLRITLTDATIKSYKASGGHGDIPEESVSHGFGKIEWVYLRLDQNGNPINPPAKTGFDVLNNRPL